MNGLYQGRLRKQPATGGGAAGFPVGATPMTQMMNPGQPVQITYKFQPTGGGTPTAQPMTAQRAPTQPMTAQPMPTGQMTAQPMFQSRTQRQTAQPLYPGRMQAQPITAGRPQEFWERQRAQRITGEPPTGERPPGAYEPWRPDWTGLQEQALRPLWEKFLAESERMQSMLSARGMGRSGALEVGEQEKWAEFMKEAGPIMADIAMREEELGFKDRWFEKQMELDWAKLGLSREEIDAKKEMFYAQLQENQRQFNREYSLKETVAMDKMEQEWRALGLTEEQIQQERYRFDQQLKWEQERFGITLEWEQRKAADELAFRYRELAQAGEISWQQLANDMTKFNAALEQTAWIERERIRIQQEQMALEDKWRMGQLTIDQYNSETARLAEQNRSLESWAKIELDRAMLELGEMEVFGYWDEGFGPDDPNMPQKWQLDENGKVLYDEEGYPLITEEYDIYLQDHYHKGTLDLREWEIWLLDLLGMRGVSNEWGDPEEHEPRSRRGWPGGGG